jgi:hypothetical protein
MAGRCRSALAEKRQAPLPSDGGYVLFGVHEVSFVVCSSSWDCPGSQSRKTHRQGSEPYVRPAPWRPERLLFRSA